MLSTWPTILLYLKRTSSLPANPYHLRRKHYPQPPSQFISFSCKGGRSKDGIVHTCNTCAELPTYMQCEEAQAVPCLCMMLAGFLQTAEHPDSDGRCWLLTGLKH